MLLFKLPLFLVDAKADEKNKILRELLAALESSFQEHEFASFHGEIHWKPKAGVGSNTYKYYTIKEMVGFIKGYIMGSMTRVDYGKETQAGTAPSPRLDC